MTIKEQLLQESIQNAQKAMHDLREMVLNSEAERTDIAFYLGCVEAEFAKLVRTIEL